MVWVHFVPCCIYSCASNSISRIVSKLLCWNLFLITSISLMAKQRLHPFYCFFVTWNTFYIAVAKTQANFQSIVDESLVHSLLSVHLIMLSFFIAISFPLSDKNGWTSILEQIFTVMKNSLKLVRARNQRRWFNISMSPNMQSFNFNFNSLTIHFQFPRVFNFS